MALHEFTEALDEKALMETGTTDWSKKVMEGSKRVEIPMYQHVKSYGDRKFFH
jgi:hypothetical protein